MVANDQVVLFNCRWTKSQTALVESVPRVRDRHVTWRLLRDALHLPSLDECVLRMTFTYAQAQSRSELTVIVKMG